MFFRRRVSSRTLIAVAVAAAACDPPPPEPEAPRVTVRDSAGIEIVENHAPEWGDSALWSVDPEPEFVIGGTNVIESPDDPSQLIWRVQGVARLSNGNILVHSGGEEAVFLFEPTGALVTRIGRKGQGPGEFVRPQHIQVLPADTIAVWDYGFTRVNYFDPMGTFIGARRLDVATVLENTRTATEYSPESIDIPLLDGSFVVQRGLRDYPQPQPGEIQRRPVEYLRIDTAYALHSFGWWRWDEIIGMRSKWGSYPWPPFPRRSLRRRRWESPFGVHHRWRQIRDPAVCGGRCPQADPAARRRPGTHHGRGARGVEGESHGSEPFRRGLGGLGTVARRRTAP